MKRTLALFFGYLMPVLLLGQLPHYTLEECYHAAVNNYPSIKQLDLDVEINRLSKANLQTNFLPVLNLNGQASYQSDVTKVPIEMPGVDIPTISKDWYAINLDIEQMVYDGGLTAGQKAVEDTELDIEQQKVEVVFYQLKKQINQLYFNVLLLDQTSRILQLLKKNLEASIEEASVAFQNGVILAGDLDGLKVEYYLAEQRIIEVDEDKRAVLGSLALLTGLEIKESGQLSYPENVDVDYQYENSRPEYLLMGKQQQRVDALSNLTAKKRQPVFMLFGQAGYGRPGYDMLLNTFDTYYKVGARLHWNIWDWKQVYRSRKILSVQREIISTEKENFDVQLHVDLDTRSAAIRKAEKLMQSDSIIVDLQKVVVSSAESKLKNGNMTTTNYLIELNKLVKAQLNLEVHKIQWIYARYQYNISMGKI